jgi:hypothetical protein
MGLLWRMGERRVTQEEEEEDEEGEELLKVRSCFALLIFYIGQVSATSKYSFLMACWTKCEHTRKRV